AGDLGARVRGEIRQGDRVVDPGVAVDQQRNAHPARIRACAARPIVWGGRLSAAVGSLACPAAPRSPLPCDDVDLARRPAAGLVRERAQREDEGMAQLLEESRRTVPPKRLVTALDAPRRGARRAVPPLSAGVLRGTA